uniref:Uncharacterized protein n=1 Tax=Anguilla anguilla TaxID=7936 RepID=A0A0E9WLU1_ANGAN
MLMSAHRLYKPATSFYNFIIPDIPYDHVRSYRTYCSCIYFMYILRLQLFLEQFTRRPYDRLNMAVNLQKQTCV